MIANAVVAPETHVLTPSIAHRDLPRQMFDAYRPTARIAIWWLSGRLELFCGGPLFWSIGTLFAG